MQASRSRGCGILPRTRTPTVQLRAVMRLGASIPWHLHDSPLLLGYLSVYLPYHRGVCASRSLQTHSSVLCAHASPSPHEVCLHACLCVPHIFSRAPGVARPPIHPCPLSYLALMFANVLLGCYGNTRLRVGVAAPTAGLEELPTGSLCKQQVLST